MPRRHSVALIIETSNAYARGLLDGIISYQREHELWSIYVAEQQRGAHPPDWLKNWKGDGIIARIETEPIAAAIRRMKLPTVDVSAAQLVEGIPWVETDDRQIAHLAFHHLIDRGFRTLAYCGQPEFNWSKWREESFIALAEAAGCQYLTFEGKSQQDADYSWNRERKRLLKWIKALPKPVGVMACYDFAGQRVLSVCRDLGIAVPEQVAVIGVDNDARLCRLCTPPLSSVIPDTRRAGYEAAKLLDRMMRGEQLGGEALLIAPLGIAERQSTDVYALDDPEVVAAMRFIREQACDGITVADILKAIPVSRRNLEQRFLKLVKRSPYAEIVRIRMERARRLLSETNLPLSEIARRTGFSDPLYLSRAFKRHMGVSPRTFRKDASVRPPSEPMRP